MAPLFDAAAFVTAPFPREERGRGFYRGAEVTEYLGLDCEMVGSGSLSLLAEVCIVNFEGEVVYHRYVKPSMEVDDYRTHVSGVRAKDLKDGAPVNQVVKDVGGLLKDRIVVGHALENDFKVPPAPRVAHFPAMCQPPPPSGFPTHCCRPSCSPTPG